MSNFFDLDAISVVEGVSAKTFSAVDVAKSALSRIQATEDSIHSFITVMSDQALESAAKTDSLIESGEKVGPLAGVPIAVKDNLCTSGTKTTCGSNILKDFIAPYDATVIAKLRSAGATIIGKANCDEFAMGSSTENSAFGPSRNPWNTEYVPGGSSGGSATAVAARQTPISLGSDTGGSIRQPAALCGIVGMKPTYGLVSRFGLVAYASSLDQIGPFSRTVADSALLLRVIAGHDTSDSTSINMPVPDYMQALKKGVSGLRIGVPKEYFGEGVTSVVASSVRAAIDVLVNLGATAEEISLPSTDYALASYYIIAPAEASSNLARYDGVKYGHRTKQLSGHVGLTESSRSEGFGAEVKQRIMIGTYALSAGYYDAYYKRAQQARTLIRRDFDEAFKNFDIIATPTSPTTAFKVGEKSDDPLAMKLADILTIPVNMAGLPAISVPCGFHNGLPIGLQLIGNYFKEETLFQAAYAFEQNTDHHRSQPGF